MRLTEQDRERDDAQPIFESRSLSRSFRPSHKATQGPGLPPLHSAPGANVGFTHFSVRPQPPVLALPHVCVPRTSGKAARDEGKHEWRLTSGSELHLLL